MIRTGFRTAVLSFGLAACGQTPPPDASPPVDPAERLEAILATDITRGQDSLYAAFVAAHDARVGPMLVALAVDSSAPPLARANAVLRMGQRLMVDFDVYARTMEDPDPRVRGATLGVVGPLATRNLQAALSILARGLVDREIGIQAKALQELRDRDLDLLRFYLDTNPQPELREIALQILRSAQAWGAPLIPEADGTLRRVAPAGVELALRPDRAWPEWEALMGTLTVAPPGGAPRVIADSVEAVGTIIPAVVDPTGRWVAVETDRRIEVHDLETGVARVVGPGIAPRPLPFTPDFMYFREYARRLQPEDVKIDYEMVRVPFGGGGEMVFDSIRVGATAQRRAWLSPLRWIRLNDFGTRFVLNTDGITNRPLPSPRDGMNFLPEADGSP